MPSTTLLDWLLLTVLSTAWVGLPVMWAMNDSAKRRRRLAYVLVMWSLPFLAVPGRGGPFWLVLALLYGPLLRVLGVTESHGNQNAGAPRPWYRRALRLDNPRSCLRVGVLVCMLPPAFMIGSYLLEFGYWYGAGNLGGLLWYSTVAFVGSACLICHFIGTFLVGYVAPAGLLWAPWLLHKGVSGNRRALTEGWLVISLVAGYRSSQAGFQWTLLGSPLLPGMSVENPLDSSLFGWEPGQVPEKWKLICQPPQDLDDLRDNDWMYEFWDPTVVCAVRKDSYYVSEGEDGLDVYWFWRQYFNGGGWASSEDLVWHAGGKRPSIIGPLRNEGTEIGINIQ